MARFPLGAGATVLIAGCSGDSGFSSTVQTQMGGLAEHPVSLRIREETAAQRLVSLASPVLVLTLLEDLLKMGEDRVPSERLRF